ncbi:MAG: hypothetical protein RR735_02530 [Bacteroidales bacterium]
METTHPNPYDSLEQFIGSRVKTINNIPVDQLLEQVSKQIACENIYGQYLNLANNFLRYIPNLGKSKRDE